MIPVDPDGRSKSARLRVHAGTIIARRIHLPADASWRDEFISEFIEFPHGQFTDQVDATTQFLDHTGELANLKPPAAAGGGALARNSSTQLRTLSAPGISSNSQSSGSGSERGLAAGRHSDGRPVTGYPYNR